MFTSPSVVPSAASSVLHAFVHAVPDVVSHFHCFRDISHQSSSLYHLLPPPRDTSLSSGLRTATQFACPISRIKKYCSFINYALNHYQVPPRKGLTLLFASYVYCVCCLLVFKLFSFCQVIQLLSRKNVNKYLYLYQSDAGQLSCGNETASKHRHTVTLITV